MSNTNQTTLTLSLTPEQLELLLETAELGYEAYHDALCGCELDEEDREGVERAMGELDAMLTQLRAATGRD